MRRFIAVSLLAIAPSLLLLAGCAGQSKPDTPVDRGPPAADALPGPAVAVKSVDVGPDADGETLTALFADAIARTAGVQTVNENKIKLFMTAGCDEPPCTSPDTQAYANAAIVVTASVMKAGESWLANGRALEGATVLGRATGGAPTAAKAIEAVGWQLGAKVREVLLARGPAPATAADDGASGDAASDVDGDDVAKEK